MEVASVNGTTVTFTTPFHITFKTVNAAQLVRLSSRQTGQRPGGRGDPQRRGRGPVRSPAARAATTGPTSAMNYCAYCWIENIEADQSNGSSVAMTGTFRSVLRDSYLHTTVDPNPGGGGYGISVNCARRGQPDREQHLLELQQGDGDARLRRRKRHRLQLHGRRVDQLRRRASSRWGSTPRT